MERERPAGSDRPLEMGHSASPLPSCPLPTGTSASHPEAQALAQNLRDKGAAVSAPRPAPRPPSSRGRAGLRTRWCWGVPASLTPAFAPESASAPIALVAPLSVSATSCPLRVSQPALLTRRATNPFTARTRLGDSAPTAASWVWCPHCSQGSTLEGERVLWPSAWALRWGLQLSGPGAPTPSKPTLESLHTAPVGFAWASPSQLANSNFRPKSGATSSRKAPAPESVP